MLEVLITFHEGAEELMKKGVHLNSLANLKVMDKLWRMKSEIANENANELSGLVEELRAELLELEKQTVSTGGGPESGRATKTAGSNHL